MRRVTFHFTSTRSAGPPPKPRCVRCGYRKKTRDGAFCGNRCAAKFGVEEVQHSFVRCDHCGQWFDPKIQRLDCCPTCKRKRTTP